jgi:hypothetical protein
MARKPKLPQPHRGQQERDMFETPSYAVDLLVPYIPRSIGRIWECACGSGRLVRALEAHGFRVAGTDTECDFLAHDCPFYADAIITNPPFSLKRQFYERCTEQDMPFALLIPFDMSLWLCEAIRQGCRLLVPTRRVDYITPTGKSGKQSSAQFHSCWLCKGMALPEQITIVDLPLSAKREMPAQDLLEVA